MTNIKVEKYLLIFFIGLLIAFFAGFGGNIIIKAESPTSTSDTEVNFEKHLQSLEDALAGGAITKNEFDSLSDILRIKIKRQIALKDENHNPEKIPDWVVQLGIKEPEGMKYDQDFSNSTSIDDPDEGFNSVTLVYTATYEKAFQEASRIAASAKLTLGAVFRAKGSPVKSIDIKSISKISYMNYGLNKTNLDFLISVEVEPSGLLTIMVTDNKQLNDCLSAYEPLNNRQNSNSKRKKQ